MEETYRPLINEIFKKASNGNVKKKKVDVLKQYDSPQLRMICKAAYDPNLKWLLPEGDVPYIENEAPEGTEHSRLENNAKTLYHYIKGGNDKLPQFKRENMFIQLLESLHKDEAKFLILVKDQKVHNEYKVSASVIKEAFDWDDNFFKNK